jgi:broad specificity phosphatase PhoE
LHGCAYTALTHTRNTRRHNQAAEAGRRIKSIIEADGLPYKLFFYISPYKRSKQTCAGVAAQFSPSAVSGVREEPQLREQDFGNFQDSSALVREKAERNAYGRFFYRFPNGESGSDVYDRITVFEDHLIRDIDLGRFPEGTNLVLVTHGLALRIFLARWFHWTVEEYESVYNPANCTPMVMERSAARDAADAAETCSLDGSACDPGGGSHTKDLYRLSAESLRALQGARAGMGEMMLPAEAWQRTLAGCDRGWEDDDDEQCALAPLEYEPAGEE